MGQINSSALATYIARQIFIGKIDYSAAVSRYPAYKDIIDSELKKMNVIPEED